MYAKEIKSLYGVIEKGESELSRFFSFLKNMEDKKNNENNK